MKCPVDKSDMMVVEHQKIELDYCLRCAGVWFDSGELDLLVSGFVAHGLETSPADLLKPSEAKVDEGRRKCPICGHKMNKVWIGEDKSRVLVDSCPLGDGLWFDGGELHQVLRKSETAIPKDIISFLGETFKATHKPGGEK
jgi:uncharacterized protein